MSLECMLNAYLVMMGRDLFDMRGLRMGAIQNLSLVDHLRTRLWLGQHIQAAQAKNTFLRCSAWSTNSALVAGHASRSNDRTVLNGTGTNWVQLHGAGL